MADQTFSEPPQDVCELAGEAQAGTSRRGFLKAIVGVFGAVAAAILAIPFVSYLVRPAYRSRRSHFAKVGDVEGLPLGKPVKLSFSSESQEAYLRQEVEHDVWVIRHSGTDLTVFSPICPHLGCHYNWVAGADEFICPCHGSHFAEDGKVLAGPAPRPLDTLPHKVEGGTLYVRWERFKAGTAAKTRA